MNMKHIKMKINSMFFLSYIIEGSLAKLLLAFLNNLLNLYPCNFIGLQTKASYFLYLAGIDFRRLFFRFFELITYCNSFLTETSVMRYCNKIIDLINLISFFQIQ